MDCKCEGWQNNIDQIMNAEVHMNLSHNIEYTGEAFKYCPWCGQEFDGGCTGCEHNLGPSIDCGLLCLTPCPRED